MRHSSFITILLLVACESPIKIPGVADTSTDTADTNDVDTADTNADTADTADTGESCTGVEVLGAVAYGDETQIYSLTVIDDVVYVSRPADGDIGSGLIDGWSLSQFDGLLEGDLDTPNVQVMGDDRRQYLGVSVFEDADAGRLCSQTYGEESAGRLLCWPAGLSGSVTEIADIDVAGETPSGFFGYGVDAPGDGVYAWDASPPNRVVRVDSDVVTTMPFSACGEEWEYCQDGFVLDDMLVTTSDFGSIYANDIETGAEAWSDDTSDDWASTNLDAWGTLSVAFGSPFARDDGRLRVYNEGGLVDTQSGFVSSVTSGLDSGGKGYIGSHLWSAQPDGSGGELDINNARTGELRGSYSYPEVIGETVGIEDASSWQEPYILLEDVGHDGLLAFAVRAGGIVGLLRVCGE